MSQTRKLRRAIRRARYLNHYGHIPGVIGGAATFWLERDPDTGGPSRKLLYVRRQAKRRVGERP